MSTDNPTTPTYTEDLDDCSEVRDALIEALRGVGLDEHYLDAMLDHLDECVSMAGGDA